MNNHTRYSPSMIDLSRVHMHYKKGPPVLTDLSLKVARGEFVLVTGASGAGKTTLLKLLYGGEKPTRGLVLVDGTNVPRLTPSAIAPFRRKIGVVFQDFKLLEDQTVFENLALVLDAAGASGRRVRLQIKSTLARVGLSSSIESKVANLSGGEQQRVAIARALVNDPFLLVADEPTGNLDPDTTRRILFHIQEAHLQGTTVVLATHDETLTGHLSYRKIHLEDGRLVHAPYTMAG